MRGAGRSFVVVVFMGRGEDGQDCETEEGEQREPGEHAGGDEQGRRHVDLLALPCVAVCGVIISEIRL